MGQLHSCGEDPFCKRFFSKRENKAFVGGHNHLKNESTQTGELEDDETSTKHRDNDESHLSTSPEKRKF